MDVIQQVLAQQHSGSAGGAGFGQFFAQGRQLQQNQQRLNLSSRQLQVQEAQEQRLQRRDDMLLPLEQQEMKAKLAILGQNLFTGHQKLQLQAQTNAAVPEILALESHFMSSPSGFKDAAGIERYKELYSRYPFAFAEGAPGYKIRKYIVAPLMFDTELQRVLEINKRLENSGVAIQDAELSTGKITVGTENAFDQWYKQESIRLRQEETELSRERLESTNQLRERSIRLRESLDPIQQRALDAKIKIIEDDLQLLNKPDEKRRQVEAVIGEFERRTSAAPPETAPAPAPAPQTQSVTNAIRSGVKKFRRDPATNKLIPVQ